MAYTNSVESGASPLEAGTTFTRGLMWAGIAAITFILATAFDYRWLKTFSWPTLRAPARAAASLTLAIGDGVGGSARWVTIGPFTFQFSELAKILMIIVLANYLGGRQGRLDSLHAILGACLLVGPPLDPGHAPAGPRARRSCFAAILAGMLWMSGASMQWLAGLAAVVIAMVPIAWTYLLRDYQKERLTSFLNPTPDIRAPGYQLYQSQIAVGSGGWFGNGPHERHAGPGRLPAGPDDRLRRSPSSPRSSGSSAAMVLFILFALLLWRVLVAGWRSRDPFGTMFAAGLASMILFQLSSTSGWSWASCRSPASRCRSSPTAVRRSSASPIGLGILQSINIRQTRAEW